ncbi:MAG: ribosome silencing factor [Hellea sp.]|jgi:ribosome-associated protein|nr:ribosome silencing factor [Hellea sp.]MBT3593885.1 ribosome silencing factor [Hellea sp.]MBT4995619.1 ribosome silencing factor [Hellea sp.]MBT5836693.1 ribosome silencing factor [Hellea sp.]MBT7398155.1 ribosome silencing factor [Hellea sp.]MDA8888137.1 ribosome silencing factor [Hellea sp.]
MPSPQDSKESRDLANLILDVLDEHSAQEIIEIDIRGKSSISDYMIVASGRSNRHVGALSDYLIKSLKNTGKKNIGIEGLKSCDWVLIDVGDVIVHLFRPEVRAFYNIEKIWSMPSPLGLNEKIQYDPENTET